MAKNSRAYAPRGISKEATKLWDSICKTWAMDPSGLTLLKNACYCLDRLRAAEAIVAEEGPVTTDRFGQKVPHPAVRVVATETANFLHTLKTLNLDIGEIPGQGRPGRPDGWQPKAEFRDA